MSDDKPEQEQPQVIRINFKEQVQTLIEAGEIAKETTSYTRRKHDTLILINDGKNQAPLNPTLAEYLYRAERKIVNDMMPEIIKEAKSMINEELTNIKELLK
jgi:hypothetical protein